MTRLHSRVACDRGLYVSTRPARPMDRTGWLVMAVGWIVLVVWTALFLVAVAGLVWAIVLLLWLLLRGLG
jgi:hypothetical protein